MNHLNKRFVLKHEIGAGGMARVFLGWDEVLDRFVAVKILKPVYGDTDVGDRFRREGRTAARLSHPNVVPVYGAGEGEFEGREVSYIVMEYVAGGDLKALLDEQGPLSNTRLALLGSEVSLGLAHAHEKGVIHRDIKPHNVLIDSYGRPKLADFGIARALDATHATQTGSYLGTALYSSPEQLQGEKVTPKSDVYSLGAALYQISTGEVPFTGTPIEVATQHINQTPPEPRALGASLSDEAEALILDCLQKNPDHRPIAEEVHERLLAAVEASHSNSVKKSSLLSVGTPAKAGHTRSYSSEASTGKPPLSGAWRDDDRRRRRRGWAILAVATLLLILLGIAAYAAVLGGEDTGTAQAPQQESQQEAIVPEDEATQPEGGEEEVPAESVQEDTSEAGQDPPEQDPARVVEEFYQSAVDRNFGRHSRTMTPEWRQANFPSQGEFENTYYTLQSLEFVVGPTTIENSGDAATVTGETIARHTDRTEHNGGTWRLVYQNGEWRISEYNVYPIDVGPPRT